MRSFRTLDLAIKLYQESSSLKMPGHLKNQLLRSTSSIALNLSEARGKRTLADQKRFFHIALGSLRESMTCLILAGYESSSVYRLADVTGAHLYKLIKNAK